MPDNVVWVVIGVWEDESYDEPMGVYGTEEVAKAAVDKFLPSLEANYKYIDVIGYRVQ